MKNSLTSLVRQACGHPDSFSCRNGVYTVRKGFFYPGVFRHGGTAEGVAETVRMKVKAALPDYTVTIIDKDEVWKPFRGGASVANQSHWWVKFTVGK
jgi:hypothetical protein